MFEIITDQFYEPQEDVLAENEMLIRVNCVVLPGAETVHHALLELLRLQAAIDRE